MEFGDYLVHKLHILERALAAVRQIGTDLIEVLSGASTIISQSRVLCGIARIDNLARYGARGGHCRPEVNIQPMHAR